MKTEEGHSDMCCRNSAGRLTTIEKSLAKFKESYEATQSKLTSTHAHKVYKRSSTEKGGQSKRALSFSQSDTSSDCFTPDQLGEESYNSLKYEVNTILKCVSVNPSARARNVLKNGDYFASTSSSRVQTTQRV